MTLFLVRNVETKKHATFVSCQFKNYGGVPSTGVFNALLSVNVSHNQYLCCLATGEQNLYKQKHGESEYFKVYVDCGADMVTITSSRLRLVPFIFIIFAVPFFVKLLFSKVCEFCDSLQIKNTDRTRITMNIGQFEKTQISAGTFKFVPKLTDPTQTFTFLNFISAIM